MKKAYNFSDPKSLETLEKSLEKNVWVAQVKVSGIPLIPGGSVFFVHTYVRIRTYRIQIFKNRTYRIHNFKNHTYEKLEI